MTTPYESIFSCWRFFLATKENNKQIFEVIDYWTAQGGAAKDLIEATDGFHPSQLANALGAMFTWDHMLSVHPDWFGPENPNNALIDELFGDQGGH